MHFLSNMRIFSISEADMLYQIGQPWVITGLISAW